MNIAGIWEIPGAKSLHYLKTWPEYFEKIASGEKTFEVRKNDRDFKVGNWLLLREWDPIEGEYTGDWDVKKVDYILKGGEFGIHEDFVVMSISEPTYEDAPLYTMLKDFLESGDE